MRKTVVSFALTVMLFVLCASAEAQQPKKIPRIGHFSGNSASADSPRVEAFRQELSKLGWIEGKNISVEYRFAEGKNDRLPQLAAELVRLKVDLIVVSGTPPALAAKKATTTIPIVMANPANSVGEGLVASLARPGGNITGFSALTNELNTKRLGAQRRSPQAHPCWASAGGSRGVSALEASLNHLLQTALSNDTLSLGSSRTSYTLASHLPSPATASAPSADPAPY